MRKSFFSLILPLLVIGGAFAWSAWVVLMYEKEIAPVGDDIVTIRIAHWQLEAGVRDGFDEMARRYQESHPNVRVRQEAIPEGTYGQWVSTQMIGGTAPDLLEIGRGLPYGTWLSYYKRYFHVLSQAAEAPNPYNAGTDLEKVPLRQTTLDGMRISYVPEMQEYMSVPLSQIGYRLFYNKDLLKELTGRDTPPETLREFLAVCKEIRSHRTPEGKPYIPIASSKFHLVMWDAMVFEPITYSAFRECDFDRDGLISVDELYLVVKTGVIDFYNPAFEARFDLLREISEYFQTGYIGLQRDEAVFLFAQQKAVFMSAGTWDAMSLIEQAEGRFEIGLMEWPRPTKSHPKYGKLVEGPWYEDPSKTTLSAFIFGITKNSTHPEVALDFLLYLASKEGNREFNTIIGWLPCIRGVKVDNILGEFQPNLDGMYSTLNINAINLGSEVFVRWLQDLASFQVGEIDFPEFVERFQPFYIEHGFKDRMDILKDWARALPPELAFAARAKKEAIDATGAPEQEEAWQKYTGLATTRLMEPEMLNSIAESMLTGNTAPDPPYQYSDRVLDKVRRRVASEMKTSAQGAE